MTALPADGRVHLIGIGGSGMSGLARILLERGHGVSGSDLRGGRACAELAAMGAIVHVGHDAAHVHGAELVAVSSAVPDVNPELLRARELGLPVLHRSELLAALMAGRRAVLVAGTHGKTTTTSMATVCLQHAGLDPSFAIGGALESGASAHDGTGDTFVAEADESDRSFLSYAPDLAIVTNVELDHHDAYGSLDETLDAFAAFLARRGDSAPAVLCADDAGAMALRARATGPVVTYGLAEDADARIEDVALDAGGSSFTLVHDGARLGPVRLRVPGMHNVRNAAAAILVARWAGAPDDGLAESLADFAGAARRFQRLGERGGVRVIDDYAHHPTEIVATLAAARQAYPGARLVAAFQPHRYSRTAALGTELGTALAAADAVVVTDVYPAGEAAVPGVDGRLVSAAARAGGIEVHDVSSAGEVPALLAGLVRPGDVVLTLGAGDITEAGPVLLRLLESG